MARNTKKDPVNAKHKSGKTALSFKKGTKNAAPVTSGNKRSTLIQQVRRKQVASGKFKNSELVTTRKQARGFLNRF